MRVIAGVARRIQLRTLDSLETRPTSDRIKETLFNMLNPYLSDCSFLDLYSGSGGIGIEALSRGAKSVVFVEKNNEAIQCINYNLKNTKLEKLAHVLSMDALSALKSLESKNMVFDIIFMDPPYDLGHEKKVVEFLQQSSVINENTIIIVESSLSTDFSYLEGSKLEVYNKKIYKTNMHVFIRQIV